MFQQEGEKCCWHCFDCTRYQILETEFQCTDCAFGYLPDADQLKCVPIKETFMRPDSVWSIGAMALSTSGIVVTLAVIIIFIKHNDTPVVRASGRELCFVLLIGILMCYGITFILVQKPTDFLCGAQKAGIGICFAVVYSAILVKTNRIERIFKAGKKTTKRPSFISPKSQLLITFGLVMVQGFFIAIWFAFSHPRAMHIYPTREDNHLVCAASTDAGYFIAFLYPLFLIGKFTPM